MVKDSIPRGNRPESWQQTTSRLKEEAASANDLISFGRAFRRLDATYPNLHAKLVLLPELDISEAQGGIHFPIEFAPESVSRGQNNFRYLISKIVPPKANSGRLVPALGDEVIALNDIPIEKWSEQNFIFCKYPLREQCELVFFENLKKELLGWDRGRPLSIRLKRGAKEFNYALSWDLQKKVDEYENFQFMDPPCGVSPKRYPGWHLAYQGYNLCAFESKKLPGTVIVRVRDFMYDEYRGRPTPPIRLPGEVDLFWSNYWRKKASNTKTVLLDVIGNPGGNEPIPYYELFFSQPFQEQYTQFKKIHEFERKDILESIYWGETAKDIWLANIKKDGTFQAVQEGQFLPHIAQFCADQKKDCREGLYQPRHHGFTGKVKLLINHRCVSSCVGFVFNFVDVFGKKVTTYGMPDSADSAYARLTLALDVTGKNKFKTEVISLNKLSDMTKDSPWIREAVSVSRSTDSKGNILSGKPMRIDEWIPHKWNEDDEQWVSKVLAHTLR